MMDPGRDPRDGIFLRVDCYQGCWLWSHKHHIIHISHSQKGAGHRKLPNEHTDVIVLHSNDATPPTLIFSVFYFGQTVIISALFKFLVTLPS